MATGSYRSISGDVVLSSGETADLSVDDATNNAVSTIQTLTHTTTGTAAAGIGVQRLSKVENGSGTTVTAVAERDTLSVVTNAAEVGIHAVAVINAGTLPAAGSEQFQVTGAGSVIAGQPTALATNATDGFFYVRSAAGVPTGTPTAVTGHVPMQYDSTNNRLYAWNGTVWQAFQSAEDDASQYYHRRALLLTGATSGKATGWHFDHFEHGLLSTAPAGYRVSTTGSPSQSVRQGTTGSISQIGTTAASDIIQYLMDPLFIANPATDRWYMGARFQISTAVDADDIITLGWDNVAGNKTLLMGFLGAMSATNYIVQYDGNFAGTTLNSSVAVDTGWHTLEMYGKADGKVYFSVDEAAAVSATMSSPFTDSAFFVRDCRAGANGGVRKQNLDWLGLLFPGN